MWERAVADLCPTATAVVLAEVVIVVLHLAVGFAVVIVAVYPMEGAIVVETELSYSRQGW